MESEEEDQVDGEGDSEGNFEPSSEGTFRIFDYDCNIAAACRFSQL
jgi:hypothetical protein